MDAQTLLESVRARLKKHEGSYAEIARTSPDLSYSWLTKVAQGQMNNPTVTSLQQLIEALDAFEGVAPLSADHSDFRAELRERSGVAPAVVGKRIDTPEAVAQAFVVPPSQPATPEPTPVAPPTQAEESDPDAVRVEPFEEVP